MSAPPGGRQRLPAAPGPNVSNILISLGRPAPCLFFRRATILGCSNVRLQHEYATRQQAFRAAKMLHARIPHCLPLKCTQEKPS